MSRHRNTWCIRVGAESVDAVQQIADREGVAPSEAARLLIREAVQARGLNINNEGKEKA
jgi:hypothetical protein